MMETTTGAPPDGGTASRVNPWQRTAAIGAGVMAAWAVALQLFAGEFIPPVAVIGAVFAALAVSLRAVNRRWIGLVAGVVPLLALAGNVPILAFDLSHPEEATVFVLAAISVVAALVTSVAGFLVWFRRTGNPLPLAAAGVGVVVVAAAVGAVAAGGVESAAALDSDVAVVTRALAFEPTEIVLTVDDRGLWVDNVDPFRHTLTVEGTDIDLQLPGSSSQRIDVDLAPGSYAVVCAVPGHEAMTATLTVEG